MEPTDNITTWIFEEGTFKPTAKIVGDEQYSITTDYLGTPVMMHDKFGFRVWECDLDIYGKVRNFWGDKVPFVDRHFTLMDCPFRYQGQYEDEETRLYYNRFRYYSYEMGCYISQDPIGLAGGNPTLYGYVANPMFWLDPFGLNRRGSQATRDHLEVVKTDFIKHNPNAKHIGGGLDKFGEPKKEIYIKPTNQIPGSTKGGSYTDLTFELESGKIVHINTVDKGNHKESGMTRREYVNAERIRKDAPESILITVRKGDKPSNLAVGKGCN